MGTNVVRLTDPKYMSDLRRRTIEDYHKMLLERIENRKVSTVANAIAFIAYVCYHLVAFMLFTIFNGTYGQGECQEHVRPHKIVHTLYD